MDKAAEFLRRESGLPLGPDQLEKLLRYVDELLKWNRRFNLTAITARDAIVEKHLLDSLLLAPALPENVSVLDAGTGAGLPALPLAIARPDLSIVAVDRTDKKITFVETAAAALRLPNVRGRHLRLEGRPAEEGLTPFDAAVSRAFAGPGEWLAVARPYVKGGGRIVVTLGSDEPTDADRATALGADRLVDRRRYSLPSGDRRGLWVVERA